VVAAPHVHPHQREDFRVESGAVDLQVGDRRERVEAGGERSVPPGTAHAWGHAGPDEAHVVVRLTSAFQPHNAGYVRSSHRSITGLRNYNWADIALRSRACGDTP
jgi:uncharacterized cupin superfamily protein